MTGPGPGGRRGRRGRTTALLSVAILVLGLVAAGVVWVAAPFGDTLESGEVRDLQAPVWGRSASVVTPGGDVDLVLGPPVERVDGQLVDGAERTDDLVSERGDRLVAVSWVRRVSSAPSGVLPTPGRLGEAVTITLRVADQDFDLEPATADDSTGWQHRVFAVAGTPSAADVRVEVTFDGLTQTVGGTGEVESGVAGGFADPQRFTTSGACALSSPDLPGASVPCTVGTTALVPYVAGQGWVEEEGESFAVVDVEVGLLLDETSGRSPDGYSASARGLRAELDGTPTVAGPVDTDASVRGALTFRVTRTPRVIELSREFLLLPDAPGDPTRTVVMSGRVFLVPS